MQTVTRAKPVQSKTGNAPLRVPPGMKTVASKMPITATGTEAKKT